MKTYIKLLAYKTCHFVLPELFLKDEAMNEVVSALYITTTLSTQEIIRQNKCKMSFLGKIRLKQGVDKTLMVSEISF